MTILSHNRQMTLEDRVATLERERKMARRTFQVTIILLLCAGVGVVGVIFTVPPTGAERGVMTGELPAGHFSSVITRKLLVLDEDGHLRASLGTEEKGPHTDRRPVALRMLDDTGKNVLALESGGVSGPSLHINSVGVGSVRVAVDGPTPLIEILDEKGKAGALLWFMNKSPHLVMSDEKLKIRAILGYEGVGSAGRGSESKPSVMAIYDAEGRVVWSATENHAEPR